MSRSTSASSEEHSADLHNRPHWRAGTDRALISPRSAYPREMTWRRDLPKSCTPTNCRLHEPRLLCSDADRRDGGGPVRVAICGGPSNMPALASAGCSSQPVSTAEPRISRFFTPPKTRAVLYVSLASGSGSREGLSQRNGNLLKVSTYIGPAQLRHRNQSFHRW